MGAALLLVTSFHTSQKPGGYEGAGVMPDAHACLCLLGGREGKERMQRRINQGL